MKKRIQIGVADSIISAQDFIHAWKRAEQGKRAKTEGKLHFQSLEILLKMLTSKRWELLRTLRRKGPMSIRSLAKELSRDYKNVHTDIHLLMKIGLVDRIREDMVAVPWDIVEARLKLAA